MGNVIIDCLFIVFVFEMKLFRYGSFSFSAHKAKVYSTRGRFYSISINQIKTNYIFYDCQQA